MPSILKDNHDAMQAVTPASLPAPDEASAQHSQRCARHLRERIAAAGGAISFAEFMHEALYAPGLGYYAAGSTKFGPAGDFVTAPEVSPLFGRILARQAARVLEQVPDSAILEVGAGTGRLAVDILARLETLGVLPAEYRILEVSPELAERQKETIGTGLPHLAERVRWLDRLPPAHRGVVVGNEVLDALPVERFIAGRAVRQRYVGVQGDRFACRDEPARGFLETAVREIERDLGSPLPEGYESEYCAGMRPWISDLLQALETGAVFLIDYGVERRSYYAADRDGGWLRCHFRHHAHDDPLLLPGIQDITSWVDFSEVASAAVGAGAQVAAYVTQANFLLEGGLAEELDDLESLPPAARMQLSGAIKTLTLPGEMGERFKCLCLTKRLPLSSPPFAIADRAHVL